MRVAILSESSADEAGLRVLVDSILGVPTVAPEGLSLRSRGWPAVRNILPTIARHLHWKGLADGLIVVADSNHATVVDDHPRNRMRELRTTIENLRSELRPTAGRVPLRIACGVASPALEAWWLCRTRAEVSEVAWERGLADKSEPYSKLSLKQMLYDVDKPNINLETERMVQAAQEATRDLALLEARFPIGFGSLLKDLRTWRTLR